MTTGSLLTWQQLLDETLEMFRIIARRYLHSGEPTMADEWYEIATRAAELTAPRRNSLILAVLQSRPGLLDHPLADEARLLGDAAFGVVRDALRDELMGRLNSLREQVVAASYAPVEDSVQALRANSLAHGSWDLFAARLDEVFLLHLAGDHEANALPEPLWEPRAVSAYIDAFVKEVMPENLDEVVALLASSPALAVRPPAKARTFEGCASSMLEEAIAEHLADLFERFRKQR